MSPDEPRSARRSVPQRPTDAGHDGSADPAADPAAQPSGPPRAGDGGDGWGDDWGADWGDDPRVAAGVEHLQRAAREVIAASRALLDAAEDLVDQPDGITRLAGVVADLGDLAGRTVRAAAGGPRPRSGGPAGPQGPDDEPGVQRIPVS